MLHPSLNPNRVLPVLALALLAGVQPLPGAEPPTQVALAPAGAAWPEPAATVHAAALPERLQRDPYLIARLSRERYEREVRDYRCVFVKQERIDGELKPVEEIDVRYRKSPASIYMTWLRNADQVKRCLYIDRPDFVDERGRKFALVEPAGMLVRLIVSKVEIPIHDKLARQASRRTIDEFGFGATLDLLDRYNEVASKRGVLNLRYAGEGVVDGRPTYVLERFLPYDGPNGDYPDARLVIQFDQETLMPVSVKSYADEAGTHLLGSYEFRQVRLNPGLTEADFRF